jgi:hypothetical protein
MKDADGRHRDGAVVVVPGDPPRVWACGEEVSLPAVERRLLLVLATARARSTAFVPADGLDEALFAGYDNLDYVRKMRNEALRHLSDVLESAVSSTPSAKPCR